MKKIITFVFAFLISLSAGLAMAVTDPIVFPKEGQDKQTQYEDKNYCKGWAEDETGVDPSYIKAKLESANENIAQSASGQRPRTGRRLMRGAALGAAMGGLDDAIDNNVGKRAAQGAVLGTSRSRQEKKQYYKDEQLNNNLQKKEQLEKQYDQYIRAFSVCMEAKGYSVR